MAKIVYKESFRNIHSITQSGDFLCLSNAAENSRVDVKKHLKCLAGRVIMTARGNSDSSYSIGIKINPIERSRIRRVEEADEITLNWSNPNTLEYGFVLRGNSTWNSEDVFGLIPIHSFELDEDGNVPDGIDLIFIPNNFT